MTTETKRTDTLIIAGREFSSRLIVGTGKYRSMEEMRDAIDASGAEMVTVAIRRLPLDPDGRPNPSATAGGDRLRNRDATGFADRLGARHLHTRGDRDHHRTRLGAGNRRRWSRRAVGRLAGTGDRRRCCTREYGDRAG